MVARGLGFWGKLRGQWIAGMPGNRLIGAVECHVSVRGVFRGRRGRSERAVEVRVNEARSARSVRAEIRVGYFAGAQLSLLRDQMYSILHLVAAHCKRIF